MPNRICVMNWYEMFNLTEAGLWLLVAAVIIVRVPRKSHQQKWGVFLGAVSFVAFGVTDVLEARHQGNIPLWLWGFKILCGVGILSARYAWRGWSTFRWRDREILFGLGCLIAVMAVMILQFQNGLTK